MTTIQIKAETDELLNQIPDDTLPSVLELLTEIKAQPADQTRLAANIKKNITEDKELLKRLAQ